MTDRMTTAKAEVITTLAADLLQAMFNTQHAHPDLPWTDMAVAATLALRGLAAQVCADDPQLRPAMAKALLRTHFEMAMSFPDGVLKIFGDDSKADGPHIAGMIPVRKH